MTPTLIQRSCYRALTLISTFCLVLTVIWTASIQGAVGGKIDVGPAFVHIDILESGHTVKRMDMWAFRGDFSYTLYEGLYIKPTVLYGHGSAAKGGIFSGGAALGYYVPCNKKLAIAPMVGVSYTHLWTKIDFPPFMLENLQERFKSVSPFIGIDLYWTICPGLRLSGSFQYSWSRTHTTIQKLIKDKSRSKGPIYGLMLEYDLSEKWSINIGGAYNISLSKEKHGLRGTGAKLGLAYWF